MMNEESISERNGYLIALITKLDMGLHIIDLPHKPRMLSADGKRMLNAYVHNFNLYLKGSGDDIYFQVKLKEIDKLNLEEIKTAFVEWFAIFEHTEIFTISLQNTGLFVSGFNHHNKILKKNPYPVFAKYDPLWYYELERAESIVERFTEYNLVINQ